MKFVRADDILRHLADRTVLFRRKQFRTDRRIDDVQENRFGGTVHPHGGMADKKTNQRFRNGTVHAVHGHVVAVVRRPPQRELGKISRSDNQSTAFVGDIHQDLGTFARLGILVCDILHPFVLSDIGEMLPHGLGDVHFKQRDTQRLRKTGRIALGPLRRPKPRHRHGDDPFPIQVQIIEPAHANKQRQRRVQSPDNPMTTELPWT